MSTIKQVYKREMVKKTKPNEEKERNKGKKELVMSVKGKWKRREYKQKKERKINRGKKELIISVNGK